MAKAVSQMAGQPRVSSLPVINDLYWKTTSGGIGWDLHFVKDAGEQQSFDARVAKQAAIWAMFFAPSSVKAPVRVRFAFR
jgi:hypothetical protein